MNRKTTRKSTSRRNRNNNPAQRNLFAPDLFIVPKVEKNPRREKTFGHKSMSVILSARKPMTVDKFVSKGGRLKDLHWDVAKGHVKVSKKAS
jgi:hypothetical protein